MLFSLFLYLCSPDESAAHWIHCRGSSSSFMPSLSHLYWMPPYLVLFLCFPTHAHFKSHLRVAFLVIICKPLTMTHAKAEFSPFPPTFYIIKWWGLVTPRVAKFLLELHRMTQYWCRNPRLCCACDCSFLPTHECQQDTNTCNFYLPSCYTVPPETQN